MDALPRRGAESARERRGRLLGGDAATEAERDQGDRARLALRRVRHAANLTEGRTPPQAGVASGGLRFGLTPACGRGVLAADMASGRPCAPRSFGQDRCVSKHPPAGYEGPAPTPATIS